MLRAIDTNIIARAVLDDDPVQSPLARSILDGPALLLSTVALKAFWLLSVPNRLPRATVAAIFSRLISLPNLIVPDREALRFALEKAAAGADFADMLHLAMSGGADMFTTFDRAIARHAEGAPVPVETL